MKRYRRLRHLEPDTELFRRRAAGEPLRELARDYGVAHTTLGRYFVRPEVVKQLQRAAQLNRAERRAAEARWRAEEKAEREARRRLRQQRAADERTAAGRAPAVASPPESAHLSEVVRSPEEAVSFSLGGGSRPRSDGAATGSGRRRFGGGAYADWLDERDARVPLTRADLWSGNDEAAARVVAAGGGMQAVIEATGLRTLENVLRLIDPAILDKARQNDAAPPSAGESAEPSPSRTPVA